MTVLRLAYASFWQRVEDWRSPDVYGDTLIQRIGDMAVKTPPALVVDAVVRDGDVCITEDHYRAKRLKAAKAWGDGVVLKVRIEPAEEAARYHQFKYLFGYVIEPCVIESGHTKLELVAMAKAQFMPEGKVSLTELNHDELDAFTQATEQWLREELPDAFILYDDRTGAA